ncbi:MAG: LPXTG cell wall anchor domain-containing protein, partial [Streptococcus mitis]|nr:LPXTG cell wall anchor domain-containing protein [Streptococcus mitis]
GNTSIEYADGKSVVFNIDDKRNNGFDGEIQDKHIYVNGKEYKSFDDIKQITDKTLNIKIVAKDFARNTTVKEFILNKDTGEVSELKPHTVTVTIQNGKEMSSKIVSEEDFILPVYEGGLEKGYQFDGWEISGVEGKKDAGYVINLSKDTLIKPVFKKIEEKKEEENKPTFDVSKKKDKVQANHNQLDESHRKEDLQRENHSHKSDSTKDVKTTVPVQVNYSQLDESQRSDSTKDVTAPVPDKNDKNFENKKEVYLNELENVANKHTNIDSKSDTNNSDRLPKTGTVREVFTSLVAGIMFTVGAFLGLKKKDQD